jgi:hypothetical protein
MKTTVEFLPRENRYNHTDVLDLISQAVFGDVEKINYPL